MDSCFEAYREQLLDIQKIETPKVFSISGAPGTTFLYVVQIVEASFSAVFRACANAQRLDSSANEMTWRLEHDSLFNTFFKRKSEVGLVMTRRQKSNAHADGTLEDPSAHSV